MGNGSVALALALQVLFAVTPCGSRNCAVSARQDIGADCIGPNCGRDFTAYEPGTSPASSPASRDWSSWLTVYGDYGISYRWRVNTYGAYISPDCEIQFKNSTGRADFRFKVNYNGGEESGTAYGITEDETFTEVVDPCRSVSSVTVTDVRRRR